MSHHVDRGPATPEGSRLEQLVRYVASELEHSMESIIELLGAPATVRLDECAGQRVEELIRDRVTQQQYAVAIQQRAHVVTVEGQHTHVPLQAAQLVHSICAPHIVQPRHVLVEVVDVALTESVSAVIARTLIK